MHQKLKTSIPLGGTVICGSRKVRLDAVEGDIATLTIVTKKGETFETRDPRQRDQPWVLDDPGEGDMIYRVEYVQIGHKIRIGNYRQFRILSWDGKQAEFVVVGPDSEIV